MKDFSPRNKSEKNVKRKDEAYYMKKRKDLKKMNIQRNTMIVEKEDSDA